MADTTGQNADANEHKNKGNELFRQEKFEEARQAYTKAIEIEPTAALYSNRSACYAELEKWPQCYEDALACLKMKPDWPKAYYRTAVALKKLHSVAEARAMCNAGIALDPENKELKQTHKEINSMISLYFTNASTIDFKFDQCPNEDFQLVFKGKAPSKNVDVNGATFLQSRRTILHVAVMMQHPKLVALLIEKGADPTREDSMGLSPLHIAQFIQNEAVLAALGDALKLQPMSSAHNATPQDIRDAMSFCMQNPPVTIKTATADGKVVALDALSFVKTMGCWYNRTVQISMDYAQCMISSVSDDEGRALLADPVKQALHLKLRESKEETKLALAYAGPEYGYGVFALEAFAVGDYVTCYGGVLRENSTIKDQARNSYVFTIMPLDKLPFKLDSTQYRSFGAYLNHSDSPNLEPVHIVGKGVSLVVFVAKSKIEVGDQLSIDYRGRLHSVFCDNNLTTFAPLKPLSSSTLEALKKL